MLATVLKENNDLKNYKNSCEVLNDFLDGLYTNVKGAPFICACELGNEDHVKWFIEFYTIKGSLDHMIDEEGLYSTGNSKWTPLSVASFYGKLNVVKILIEHGVNVDKPRIRDGKTALMFACSEGNIEIIKVLIEHGAKINEPCSQDGKTALMLACSQGNIEIVKHLLDHGGKVGLKDRDNKSAFVYALIGNKEDIVKSLLENATYEVALNAKVNFEESCREITTNEKGAMKLLLNWLCKKLIAKYEEEFPDGTPIVCACQNGRFEDVKLLITGHNDGNGSNGNNNNMTLKEYVNQFGKTSGGGERIPLIAAARNEHFQIVKYLIEQGEADPNIANWRGENALHRSRSLRGRRPPAPLLP